MQRDIMIKMKKSILMLLPIAAMLATGCSKDKNGLKEADNGVRFTSNIPAITATPRATDDGKWESGDKIGVFMMPTRQGITKALPKTNAMYSAQAAGNNTSDFTATGNDLLSYPSSGNVDFIAYHPYKSDLTGTTIDIDVKLLPSITSIQSSQLPMWLKRLKRLH